MLKAGLLIVVVGWASVVAAEPGEVQPRPEVAAHLHRIWDRVIMEGSTGETSGWGGMGLLGSGNVDDSLVGTLAAGAEGAPARIAADLARKIWRAARPDGVVVRPDSTLKPIRESALALLTGTAEPMVAWAYTEHEGQRTAYVICYRRSDAAAQATFTPADMGFNGEVMVLNRIAGVAWRQPAEEPYLVLFDPDDYAYFEIAPSRPNGLVFFGDQGKFVSNGRGRIAGIVNVTGGVLVSVDFAPGEKSASLFGYARLSPVARVRAGGAGELNYNTVAGKFTVAVSPPGEAGGRAEVEIVVPEPVFTQPLKD